MKPSSSATFASALILVAAGWGFLGWFPYSQLAILVGCFAFLLVRRRVGIIFRSLALTVGPMAVSLTAIQSLLYPGAPYDTTLMGPIAVKSAGLQFALEQSLRVSTFALAGLSAVDGVPTTAWATAFGPGGFGRRLGLMVVSSLILVRDLRRRLQLIVLAQRSRGYHPSGLFGRAFGLTALAGPLATSMLIEADQRAVTLVVKGFLDEPAPDPSRLKLSNLLLATASVVGLTGLAVHRAL